MESREQEIVRLRLAVEQTAGRKMRTNRDFELLAESICEKTKAKISPTTLKRIWGYVSEDVRPRPYTLDQLCLYVGYEDFDAFIRHDASLASSQTERESQPGTTPRQAEEERPGPHRGRKALVAAAAAVVVALLLAVLMPLLGGWGGGKRPIVTKGQHFESYEDYQQLFGLASDTNVPYFVRFPEKPYIVLWAPEHRNPVWHNEGDSAAMMPTITERYHPDDWPTDSASMAALTELQKNGYITAFKQNQLRLCFMKNLTDSGFVFLGVYCLSSSLSDTTKLVWERCADEVTDIERLDLLRP
ncbi:MAG: hypothetical protein IJ176_04215 [Prevotella sp.]|nr:hypothetical protein [Prevotella sp.]